MDECLMRSDGEKRDGIALALDEAMLNALLDEASRRHRSIGLVFEFKRDGKNYEVEITARELMLWDK